MVDLLSMRADVVGIIKEGGVPVRFRYFTFSGADAGYDDDVTITQSGVENWTSGLVHPVDDKRGAQQAFQGMQGRVLNADLMLYVDGGVEVSGLWKLGLDGSPVPGREFAVAGDDDSRGGIISWPAGSPHVYHKIYLKHLTAGSLIGE